MHFKTEVWCPALALTPPVILAMSFQARSEKGFRYLKMELGEREARVLAARVPAGTANLLGMFS